MQNFWSTPRNQPYCFIQMRMIFINSSCLFENLLKPSWFLRPRVNCETAPLYYSDPNVHPQCARFQFAVRYHGKAARMKPASLNLVVEYFYKFLKLLKPFGWLCISLAHLVTLDSHILQPLSQPLVLPFNRQFLKNLITFPVGHLMYIMVQNVCILIIFWQFFINNFFQDFFLCVEKKIRAFLTSTNRNFLWKN